MLNAFSSGRTVSAEVDAPAEKVWSLLVQPSLIARHTPFVSSIRDIGGNRWRWELVGIPYPGGRFEASFTEQMRFEPPHRITFDHEPADRRELAGALGTYTLTAHPSDPARTTLHISLTVTAHLPLPKRSEPVVAKAMDVVITQMGERFSRGLLEEIAGVSDDEENGR